MDIFHVRCRLDQPRGVTIHLVPEDMLQFLMGVAAHTFFSNVGYVMPDSDLKSCSHTSVTELIVQNPIPNHLEKL
jgi:hypothetical protein